MKYSDIIFEKDEGSIHIRLKKCFNNVKCFLLEENKTQRILFQKKTKDLRFI